jgi:hypothetical protein
MFATLLLRGTSLAQERSPQSFLCVKASWFSCWEPPIELWSCAPTSVYGFWSVPPIPPLSGNELASVACSPENKVSLCGIGGLCVATPLQHRRTSPQKEGTTGIHPHVSGLHSLVLSYLYLYLTCILLTYLLACHL